MNWNVKEHLCYDGVTFSSIRRRVYHFDPSVRIKTSRELTADERRRVIDALVKEAAVEMIRINKENRNESV